MNIKNSIIPGLILAMIVGYFQNFCMVLLLLVVRNLLVALL